MTPDEEALRSEIRLRAARVHEMAKDLDEPWNLTGIATDGEAASKAALKLGALLREKRDAAKLNGAGGNK